MAKRTSEFPPFLESPVSPRALRRAACVAVEEVLRVKKGERVVIVTNPEPDVLSVSRVLYDASLRTGAVPLLLVQPRRTSLENAHDGVIHALRSEPEVILSISADKLGKDRFGLEKPYRFPATKGSWPHIFNALLGAKKTRSFWTPSITAEMFARTVPVDYEKMRALARRLSRELDRADLVKITSVGGTDLEIGLAGRKSFLDDGAFWKPGSGGNLPAGEVFVSPANYEARGVVVFDGSLSVADGGSAFLPSRPVRVEVEGGLVRRVSGGAGGRRLEKSLRLGEEAARRMKGKKGWTRAKVDRHARNARHLGELGIGLNPKARITGNMLEDEKVLGTCHLAIGSNYDEDAPAFIHLDCLVRKPTIRTFRNGRGKTIMEEGRILV